MAETLCQKRALEAFRLDPAKWGGSLYDIFTATAVTSAFSLLVSSAVLAFICFLTPGSTTFYVSDSISPLRPVTTLYKILLCM